MTIQESIDHLKSVLNHLIDEYPLDSEALDTAIHGLESWADLKKQITNVKRSIKSENSDYLTGYICALSAVEGMIAEIETGDNK